MGLNLSFLISFEGICRKGMRTQQLHLFTFVRTIRGVLTVTFSPVGILAG